MEDRIKKIFELAKIPMKTEQETKRVEIIMLKFNENADIIDEAISNIVNHTHWPFKLTIYDNRPNSANTSRIWNKLVEESTCEYICIIDSDAFVPTDIEPCWLTRMMESIDEFGLVVPMGDNVGGANKADQALPYPHKITSTAVWSGFCFLFEKSMWKEAGKFDNDFYIYGQDSEFAHRYARKIGGAIFRTDVFMRHIGGYSFKKADNEGKVDREADKQYAGSLYRLKTSGKL